MSDGGLHQYGTKLDQLDIHLSAMRARTVSKGADGGRLAEPEAASLVFEWWRSSLAEEE